MFRKPGPFESFFRADNDLLAKAESSARGGGRRPRNNGAGGVQSVQDERPWSPSSVSSRRHRRPKYDLLVPVNVQAGLQHPSVQQASAPPAFLLHRPFSDAAMLRQGSNLYFRRNEDGMAASAMKKRTSIERQREQTEKLRTWRPTAYGKKLEQRDDTKNPGFIFTLMSYNVLAQDLLNEHQYLYHEHDKRALSWEMRWTNLMHEINTHVPEIMCLQEVQRSHIPQYFSTLENMGYESIYKQRTGLRTDGCAIYFKKDVLTLVEHIDVEFLQPNITILNRDNVAIIAKFAPKENPAAEFIVSTTHLLYNPRRQDVRLAQTQVLLSELERIAYKRKTERKYLPIIITGDFNSTPDSAIYELIRYGTLEYQHLAPKSLERTSSEHRTGKTLIPPSLRINDRCQHADLFNKRDSDVSLSRQEELKLVQLHHSSRTTSPDKTEVQVAPAGFCTGKLTHNFPMLSVYLHNVKNDIEGTTYQDEWHTVDYIFYSGVRTDKHVEEDRLRLISRYTLPTSRQLQNVRIPNMALGSDHFSLLGRFKLEY